MTLPTMLFASCWTFLVGKLETVNVLSAVLWTQDVWLCTVPHIKSYIESCKVYRMQVCQGVTGSAGNMCIV